MRGESAPKEYSAAIIAYGRMNNIESAEKIFETLSILGTLRVYKDNECYEKGKMLIKTMEENGVSFNCRTVDWVVGLFLDAGEIDVAESVLVRTVRNGVNTMFRTLHESDESVEGDVSNAENIFSRMRECGYVARVNQFSTLLLAYMKDKKPAYGIKERMKAES